MNSLRLLILIALPIQVFANEVLWKPGESAVAFCKSDLKTICFVVVDNISTDVSIIEAKNLGKLGVAHRSASEEIKTFPSSWSNSNDSGNLIWFTTKVRKNGKWLTAKGPVYVNSLGKYIQQ